MRKIGVIGCGVVSGYGHLPAIRDSKDWELHAIADTDPERLAKVKQDYSVPHAFSDYRELLDLPGLSAVTIATHADTHHEIALSAIEHGLHVLCEKPMASNLRQCEEMVAAADRKRVLLAVNFNTRCGTVYRSIKQQIDKGAVGTVRVVRYVYDWSVHQWNPPERMQHFMDNGGPIIDSGVHFFEGVRWFTGQDFERIDASGIRLPPHKHPQHVIATCRMTGGAIGLVEAGWLYCKHTKDGGGHLFQVDVIGDDGAISYDSYSKALRVFSKGGTEVSKIEDLSKHFELTYTFLSQSINEGSLVELASGLDGLKATEAAYQALEASK